MKLYLKCTLLLLMLTCLNTMVKAQVILDTIFTNKESSVSVRFGRMVDHWQLSPDNANTQYNISSIPDVGVSVEAATSNPAPAHLFIIIRKKQLHFVLMYKKVINYNNFEDDHDFTTQQKIDDRFEQRENEAKNAVAAKNVTEVSKPANKKANADDNEASVFMNLLYTGEEKFKKQLYAEAKPFFEKAHKMRPDDGISSQRLIEIKQKTDENEKKDLKVKEAYKSSMAAGDKAFKQNNLTEARKAYTQAAILVKDDKAAKDRLAQIDEKENKAKQNETLENNYQSALAAGDKAFQKENYDDARTYYTKALGFIKRPEPQQQIDKINKIFADEAAKDAEAKTSKTLAKEQAKKEKDDQAAKKKYYSALKSADNLFKDGELAKARSAYTKLLDDNIDTWPKDQIAKIDKLLIEQDLKAKSEKEKEAIRIEKERKEKELQAIENKYAAALEKAEDLFKANKYADAKPAYRAAIAIIKKPYPEEQIKKIDKILADQAVAEKAEKLRIEKEKANTLRYTTKIGQADKELGQKNYTKAKQFYQDALVIKPGEAYAKQKLDEIQSAMERIETEAREKRERLAAEAEAKKKYDLALSKAKSYFLKEDLENAKLSYEEAAGIKPNETEPKNQLKIIADKIAQNAIDEKYQAKLAFADSLLLAKNYESAKLRYAEALDIKKTESYPRSQIKYCDSEMKLAAAQKEEDEKYQAQQKLIDEDNRFRETMAKAKKFADSNDYPAARDMYAEALKIRPDDEYAKKRFDIFEYQSGKKPVKEIAKNDAPKNNNNNAATDPKEAIALIDPQKQTKSPYELQIDPLPYTAEELKTKYPNIDFTALPPEQPFSDEAVDSRENNRMFNEVLTDKPRLDIDDKDHKIKLICQGLNFVDRAVYLKLLVQNNSDNDFLTGSMMLTWIRTSGSRLRLYPIYIYPSHLPIIQPGKEAVLIYVCKSYNIGDKDELNFELTDRMNKIKLKLDFKGSVYNTESMR